MLLCTTNKKGSYMFLSYNSFYNNYYSLSKTLQNASTSTALTSFQREEIILYKKYRLSELIWSFHYYKIFYRP